MFEYQKYHIPNVKEKIVFSCQFMDCENIECSRCLIKPSNNAVFESFYHSNQKDKYTKIQEKLSIK